MARWRRRPAPGQTVLHSDRGAQYTSWAFGHRLRDAGLLGSMGRVGSAYDNAMMGVLLRDAATRTARPSPVGDTQGACVRDLRMDRGLVQPPPPAHLDRLSQSRGLRTTVHSRCECGMIVQEANCPGNRGRVRNVSGEELAYGSATTWGSGVQRSASGLGSVRELSHWTLQEELRSHTASGQSCRLVQAE